MRRNLFMLTFGLLSGTVGAGCLHDTNESKIEGYRANITSDLGKQKDPIALAKPERTPLAISPADAPKTVSATGVSSASSTKKTAARTETPTAPLAAKSAPRLEPNTRTEQPASSTPNSSVATSPRQGLFRSGAREVAQPRVTQVVKEPACNCATTPTVQQTIVIDPVTGQPIVMASQTETIISQPGQYTAAQYVPAQDTQLVQYTPAPNMPAPVVPAQYVQAPGMPGQLVPAQVVPAQHMAQPQVPGQIVPANHVVNAAAVVPQQAPPAPQTAEGAGNPGYLIVPDNSDLAVDQMKKGVVLWDAPPLQGKGASVQPGAFSSPIEKVRSVVEPVIDGQVIYKAQPELSVPNTPVAISQTVVGNIENIQMGPHDNFQSITGQIHSFKGSWRLRYANIESADPYGGCVAMIGEGLDALKEGQIIRVYGVIVPPVDRATPHRYQATRVEIIAGQ